MFIANLFFDRPKAPEDKKRIRIGKLWYDKEKARAALLLTGIRLGQPGTFAGRTIDESIEAPYISGDIVASVGTYKDKEGKTKHEYQWCGHIQSMQAADGKTLYTGVIEVMPLVGIDKAQGGLFLSVFEGDKAAPQKTEPKEKKEVPRPVLNESDNPPF